MKLIIAVLELGMYVPYQWDTISKIPSETLVEYEVYENPLPRRKGLKSPWLFLLQLHNMKIKITMYYVREKLNP